MNTLKLIWKARSYPIEKKYTLNSIVLKKAGYEMLKYTTSGNEIKTSQNKTFHYS